jgi:hypothetical protein
VGVAITASPTQLGWTTRIFDGFDDIGSISISAVMRLHEGGG